MLMQSKIILKNSATRATICMVLMIVVHQVVFIVKHAMALLAVSMTGTLDPVLFQAYPHLKIHIAIMTDMVHIGVVFVLLESVGASKVPVAAFTVVHYEMTREVIKTAA